MVESTTTVRSIRDERLDRGSRQATLSPAVRVDARYARYVGRVGALAVALGVGIAVASGFGAGTSVAWADQEAGASDNSPTADTPPADVGEPGGEQGAGSDGPASGNDKADGNVEGVDSDGGMNVGSSGGLDDSANDSGQSTDTEDQVGADAAETPDLQPDLSTEAVKTPPTTSPPASKKTAHKNDPDSTPSTPASISRDTTNEARASVGSPTLDSFGAPTLKAVVPADAGSSEAPVLHAIGAQAPTTSRLTVADSSITPMQEPAGIPGALVDVASKFVAAILSPFLSSGAGGPAEPPLGWALLAFARREIDSLLGAHEPVSAPILNSVTVDSPSVPMAAAAAANSAPTAVADNVAATRNIARTFTAAQLVGNDTDPEGDALTVDSVSGAVNGTVVKNADGTVTFTPTKGTAASFTYRVADTSGAVSSNSAKVSITVAANEAPTAVPDTATIGRNVATTFTAAQLVGNDTDPDIVNGDTLTVKSVSGATHGTVVKNADGTVTFTPTANYSGPASFTYKVADVLGKASANTATVSITVGVNQAPTAVADSATVGRNVATTFTAAQLVGNDTDPDGDALKVNSVDSAVNGTVVKNTNGTVTFTPTANYSGPASFTYKVADASGAVSSNSALVTITVAANQAPTAVADSASIARNVARIFTSAQLVGNDTDPDGDALAVSSVDSAVNGTVVKNADGTVTFTPTANYSGAASFNYRVADTSGAVSSNSAKVSITVAANQAPTAVADTATMTRNVARTFTAAQLVGNDTDPEGDALTVKSVSGATHGTVVKNADGSVTFTPTANYSGSASFTYKVADTSGAVSSNSAKVNITVAANQAPTAVPDSVNIGRNVAATLTAAQLVGNDTDPEGDALKVDSVSGAFNGTVVKNANGTVTFTPTANYSGPASFTYKVADTSGAVSTNSAQVSITVAANQAPTAVPDSVTVTKDVARTFTAAQLVGNDTDPEGDALKVDSVGGAVNGTVVKNADGTVTFTPTADYIGPASFTYRVADTSGAVSANSATVSVTVVNSAPVANNDAYSGPEDTIVTGNVLTNDTGAVNVSLGTAATYGSVNLNPNGSFTYTPNTNFHGIDNFTYTATNGAAQSNTATVTLTVTPVDDVLFQFNYGTGSQYWTPAARAALQAAAGRVAEYIATTSPVTITYDVTGVNDSSFGYLAYSGSSVPSTAAGFYDDVVATKIQSVNHIDGNGAAADGNITWNFYYKYEYGDDQAPDENDFQTVAMHELLHTFGYLSFLGPAGSNTKRYWFTYDKFMVDSTGARVIGDDGRFNTAYNSNLSGGNGGLYFGGPNAIAAYGGPVPVEPGSEAHLRGATFTGANRKLMTPTITTGKTLRVISPVEMGILKDLGYTVVTPQTSVFGMAAVMGQDSQGAAADGIQSGARAATMGDTRRDRQHQGGLPDTAPIWLLGRFRVA